MTQGREIEQTSLFSEQLAVVQSDAFRLQLENSLRILGPMLVRKQYRDLWKPETPTLGLCYVISEYLFYRLEMLPTPTKLPTPEGMHWYLQLPDAQYLDLAADRAYDYSLGKPKSFMTSYLSERGQKLKQVLENL